MFVGNSESRKAEIILKFTEYHLWNIVEPEANHKTTSILRLKIENNNFLSAHSQ